MEILFQSVGPGVHCYSPFTKSAVRESSINLEELCKKVILKCVTLRRLATGMTKLPLPKRLLQFISELTTADFEQIECAPFSDAFSCNFFHRALTYRVVCLRDHQEYIIAYGYSPVEDIQLKMAHEEWVQVQHKNVMCICATVKDPSTDNIFYVYDQPYASLEQMWSVYCERSLPIPEIFFIRLTKDLCEALKYVLSRGLYYGHFGLDNVFIVRDRLVLENRLMRKCTKFVDRSKKVSANEQSVICDILKILKSLQKSYEYKSSHNKILQTLLRNVENEVCIDKVLNITNKLVRNEIHFSFLKLIQSLKS